MITSLNDLGAPGAIGFISGAQDSLTLSLSANAQIVSGFNMTHGDQIDLTGILAGVALAHDLGNLGSFITTSTSGSNTSLQITGLHGSDSVQLTGVGALSLQALVNGNAFVLPPH